MNETHARNGFEEFVVAGKTSPPRFNQNFVRRTRLIETIRGSATSVVAVAAPAGYGKTSLLAEWWSVEQRATAWLTLDPVDDDPAAFMALFAMTCRQIAPEMSSLVSELVDEDVLARTAPALALALSSVPPFVLFIDDLHLLTQSACFDALEIVLSGVPEGSQVVLASRQPVARGYLGTAAVEVGVEDLALDAEGARVIAAAAGVDVAAETLREWVDRCQGWAAGMHMCALLSRAGHVPPRPSDTLLADYLYQECVKDLSPLARDFLLGTSILQSLLPELCDAVLERSDSATVLRDLEERQFFITSDEQRLTYRLHPLFREYCLGELARSSSSKIPDLHARASQWFQQRGQIPMAIEHAIAGGFLDTAAGLLVGAAIQAYEAGQLSTLNRWLSDIGDVHLMRARSTMAVMTWVAILNGPDAAAERWGTLLGYLPDSPEVVDGMNIVAAKAMVRAILMRQGPADSLQAAELGVSLEAEESPWRDPALQILGSTLLHSGDSVRGVQTLEQARRVAEAHENPATIVMCEAELALLAIERDDWNGAELHSAEATQLIDQAQINGYVMCAYAHAAAACVELHAERQDRGRLLLAQAMSERERCMHAVPLIGIPARLLLVRAELMVGDSEAAEMLLAEIDEILPPAHGREALDARIAQARLMVREQKRAGGSRSRSAALSIAEQRVLPYLQTHLSRAEIAERLFVAPTTVSSQITAIFRKLGVRGRAEAVKRATELGLLGEPVHRTRER